MEYKLILHKYEIEPYIAVIKQAKILAVDTETTGLDVHSAKLRLIQIAAVEMPVLVIDCFSFLLDGVDIIREILESKAVKVFQNAKFDLQFFMSLNIFPSPVFDTMLAGQLLRTSGGSSRVGLDALAQHYLNEMLAKDEQKSDWTGNLNESQLEYAAKDAEILLRLREVMVKKLYENHLAEVALIEFSCSHAVAQMEYHGISLDVSRWNRLLDEKEKERESTLKILRNFAGEPSQISLFDDEIAPEHNFDSNPFVLDLLRSNGIPARSTSKNELSQYRTHPLVRALSEYRKASKALSSFLYPIPGMINPKTGRLHPQYGQFGAGSGRMTCWGPNLQQIPRSADFRACFIAPIGRKFVIADYSQIELRVAADMTRDKRMTEAYRSGEDLHRLTASLVLDKHINSITKQERQSAKAVNFGLIYSMGAAGLQQYASQSYGVAMTLEQAEEFRNRFFKAYAGIEQWHKNLKKSTAKEIRTLTGRKFLVYPNSGLSLLSNMPVQGTAADIAKKALGVLAGRFKGTDTFIIGMVHDEILLETPDKKADKTAETLKSVMEEAGNSIMKHVPCQADVSVSQNWAGKA